MANFSAPLTQYFYTTGAQPGFDLTNYLVINGGGNVYQVRSIGPQNGDRPGLQERLFPSIQSAVQQCRSNRGDVVLALEGHVEPVSTANWLSGCPDGVAIVGQGVGAAQAQINFTVAGANLGTASNNLAANNIVIAGFNIDFCNTAAVVVTAPVKVTGADVAFVNNRFRTQVSATQLSTAPFEVAAGGDRFNFVGNATYNSEVDSATNPTNLVLVSAAVKGCRFVGNEIAMALNATGTGIFQFSAAALDTRILNNVLKQFKASSTAALVGFAGVTGTVAYNELTVLAATGGATAIATQGNWALHQNFGVALGGAGRAGILIGTASS